MIWYRYYIHTHLLLFLNILFKYVPQVHIHKSTYTKKYVTNLDYLLKNTRSEKRVL